MQTPPIPEDLIRGLMTEALTRHDYLVSALESTGQAAPPDCDWACALTWSIVTEDTEWPEDLMFGTRRKLAFPPGTIVLRLITATDSVLATARIFGAMETQHSLIGGLLPVILQPGYEDELDLDAPLTSARATTLLALTRPDRGSHYASTTVSVILPSDLTTPLILLTIGQPAGCPP